MSLISAGSISLDSAFKYLKKVKFYKIIIDANYNGLKCSTEKYFFWPKLKKNLLKNRLSIRVRNFAPLNEPLNVFIKKIFILTLKSPTRRDFMV